MTYEELRQRCLNYAQMHPSNPGRLQDIVSAAARVSTQSLMDTALELARYIDHNRAQEHKPRV